MGGCRCRCARENEDTVIRGILGATNRECAKLLCCTGVFLAGMVVWVVSGTPAVMLGAMAAGVASAWYGILVLAGSAARAEREAEGSEG